MQVDKHGTPEELAKLTRLIKSKAIKSYTVIITLTTLLLLVFGVIEKWPDTSGNWCFRIIDSLGMIIKAKYMDFLPALIGMLISIAITRFAFMDAPSENTALDAGIVRVTKTDDTLAFVKEVYDKIGKSGPGEVIISDNWLCSLKTDMKKYLSDAVIKCIKRGGRVHIIMMHPNSPLAHRRELVVAHVRHEVSKNVKTSLSVLGEIYRRCIKEDAFAEGGGGLFAYCIDSYLSLSVYAMPNEAYVGFFGAKDTSILGPQMLVKDPGMILEEAKDYVEAARSVGKFPQAVNSYDNKAFRYGTQINLADFTSKELNLPPLSEEKEQEILTEKAKMEKLGALSPKLLFDQVLESQAIDFYNIISKKDALKVLVEFLRNNPEELPHRRKSKDEIARLLKQLSEQLNKKNN